MEAGEELERTMSGVEHDEWSEVWEQEIPIVHPAEANLPAGIEQDEWSEVWEQEIPIVQRTEADLPAEGSSVQQVEANENAPDISVAENIEVDSASVESINNGGLGNEPVAEPNVSVEMPSQQLQGIDSIFSMGGQEFFLNNCGSKRLVIGFTSPSIPIVNIIFKLHDIKNGFFISFGKKAWDKIVSYENEIKMFMDHNIVLEVFHTNKIRVETQHFYHQCCVQFYDEADMHVCMMKPTFLKMMSLKEEVENVYAELIKKKNDITKRIKLFVDVSFFHLFKSNNIDNRHNYNWVTLFLSDSNTSNFLELSKSIASTWTQLGEWVANNQNDLDPTNEP